MPVEKLRPAFTFTEDRLRELEGVAPEAFADGRVNWDVLREALGEHLEDETQEHFGLTWPGKREARRLASMSSKGTLVPVPGEGVEEDTTRNVLIEGDNLEVLKLLQKSYTGRVKMIYIDPPYNTGNDFIYKDDYSEPLEAYLRRTGQMDEDGRALTTNTRASGRFHSNWLSMMYPRLKLARDLLGEDGVLVVSIDDNEVHHLRAILNELFGEENFLANVIVQSNKRGQTYKQISKTHEYLLIYTKEPSTEINELEKSGDKDDLNLDDDIGRYNIRELRNRNPKFGRHNRPNLYYPIYVRPDDKDADGFCPITLNQEPEYTVEVLPLNSQGKESCWRWGIRKVGENIRESTLVSILVARQRRDGGYNIYEKYRKSTYKAKSIWVETEVINEKGTLDLRVLSLAGYFDFPKPVFLIRKIIALCTDADSLVLDFFAGSGTTGQAVLEQNRLDGGNRKFILVQYPEPIEGLPIKHLSDVTRKRLKHVIERMHEAVPASNENKASHTEQDDLGFSVYSVGHSNFRDWKLYSGSSVGHLQSQFDTFESPLVDGWGMNSLKIEILLTTGFPLDSVMTRDVDNHDNEIYRVESSYVPHLLYFCLDSEISNQTAQHLLVKPSDVFVCLDSALTDEDKIRLTDRCNLKVI